MTDALSFVRGGVTAARRSVDAALALPRIALALERLADSADDLRRLADTADDARRMLATMSRDDLTDAQLTLRRLADAVANLNAVVASLNTTVSPLQGATERFGRLVDRLPQGRRRILDVDPDASRVDE
jgi:ABC-type transporter Mla subunit MlaD